MQRDMRFDANSIYLLLLHFILILILFIWRNLKFIL